jgi:hypothetical protein
MARPRVEIRVGALLAASALALGWCAPLRAARYDGRLSVTAVDAKTKEPIPVRMELRDARGRAVRIHPDGAVVDGDSICFDGTTTLELRRGAYTFLVAAGPEFTTRTGEFAIERRAEDATEVSLDRRVDMRAEGWWAGDLDVQIPLADAPLVMRAASVDFAPMAAAVNENGRCVRPKLGDLAAEAALTPPIYGPWAARDVRRGGGLLTIGAEAPFDVCTWKADDPSLPAAKAAREAGACVVAASAAAWDLPLWVAAGNLDAVQIITATASDAAAKGDRPPPDRRLFPGAQGPGRYVESIYHHLLNCGLRLPPAAGSGAGQSGGRGRASAPLGANRVYVHCGETCTREAWLDGLRRGRISVTNGPLLRTRVEGEPPGHVFKLDAGQRREFQIALDLAFYSATQIEYLEILQNGAVVHHVRLDELAQAAGRLPPVVFDSSGWFLVRAVTNNPDAYEFASTGPYYVESNYQRRISRASVQYFLDWLDAAEMQFAGNPAVVAEIAAARPFWQSLTERATVD